MARPQGGLGAAQSSVTGHSSQRGVRSKARGAPLCCWRCELWKSGGQWQGPRGSRGEADFVLTLLWELGCPWQLSGKRAARSAACLGRAPPAGVGGGSRRATGRGGSGQDEGRAGARCGSEVETPPWANRLKEEQISVCMLSAPEEGVRAEVGPQLGRTRSWWLGEQRPLSKERREDSAGESPPGQMSVSAPGLLRLAALRQPRLSSRVGPPPPARGVPLGIHSLVPGRSLRTGGPRLAATMGQHVTQVPP